MGSKISIFARTIRKNRLTTDLTDFIGQEAAVKISKLCTIKTFASRYKISERGVMRHAIKGDLPVVIIDEHIFIVDLGLEELSKIGTYDVHEAAVQMLENKLAGKLNNIKSVKSLRAKKSGHTSVELRKEFIKDKNLCDIDYLKLGINESQ